MASLMIQRRDGNTEILEFLNISDAWQAFRMFAEAKSSDIYAHVSIREGERTLAVMVFLEDVTGGTNA